MNFVHTFPYEYNAFVKTLDNFINTNFTLTKD